MTASSKTFTQALVPPIAVLLVNVILAELNGLRLLAPGALLGNLASMIDASLAKAFGVLFETP
jgi:hypothetical protein